MKTTAIQAVIIAGAVTGSGCLFLIGGVVHSKAWAANVQTQATMHINGNTLQSAGVIPIRDKNQTIFIPIHDFVAVQPDYPFSWSITDSQTNNIELSDGLTTVCFPKDKPISLVNGKTVNIGSSPWKYNDKIYVPLPFLEESFNLKINWAPDYLKTIPLVNRDGKIKAEEKNKSTAQSLASLVIDFGKCYIGIPYVRGGTTPEDGFDCSGYICFIFKEINISLPRTSQEMYNKVGKEVHDLCPGDLVFFSSNKKSITHVGLYIGNNQYLNASSGKAQCVIISNLSSVWSKSTYVGAKRIL